MQNLKNYKILEWAEGMWMMKNPDDSLTKKKLGEAGNPNYHLMIRLKL